MDVRVITETGLDALISQLWDQGYRVVGPVVADDVISLGPLAGIEELPKGWHDNHSPGAYDASPSDDLNLFEFVVGPKSAKQYLFPPHETVLTVTNTDGSLSFDSPPPEDPPIAFVGVRPCDVAAISVQDKVLTGGPYVDRRYEHRRESAFIVAVNCATPAATCFCTSMGTGPTAAGGFDIALTELLEDDEHVFVASAATARGQELLHAIQAEPASSERVTAAERSNTEAAAAITKTLAKDRARTAPFDQADEAFWDDIADRCFACGNCTLVCPTCFCSTTDDMTDLEGTARRERRWDSCFGLDFTNLHGHPVRGSVGSRYRQWITHKLSGWYDQFGTSGCVGCGRCITWCPAGIDITEEFARLIDLEEVPT